MRTTEPFTIKQCNRVADAWSVVCGPGAPVPPLSFHSFHYGTTTPWRCPLHLGVLFDWSFPPFCSLSPLLYSPALRDSLPSTLDPKVVTHPPIGYYDHSGIPRRSFLAVITEFPDRERENERRRTLCISRRGLIRNSL